MGLVANERNMSGLAESYQRVFPDRHIGRAVAALERLARLAAALCDARTATLLMYAKGRSRVVARTGQPFKTRMFAWSFDEAPYGPADRFLVTDVTLRPELKSLPIFTWADEPRFLLRVPVLVDGEVVLSLMVTDAAPRPGPTPDDEPLLQELLSLMRDEFALVRPLLEDDDADVTVALTLDDVRARAEASPIPTAILDDDLRMVFANAAAAAVLERRADAMVGAALRELVPVAVDTTEMLFRAAFTQKLTAPEIELGVMGRDGAMRTFRVLASPFSPIETRRYFLQVVAREVTALAAREESIDDRVGAVTLVRTGPPEPTAEFLFETLVERRALRARNGITYLTLRSWRQAIRAYQIKALVALKTAPPPAFVDRIATEIETEIASLIGGPIFRAIVPIPCGHSSDHVCLSTAIANRLGARMKMPVLHALGAAKLKGKSHPKTNAKRPPLRLVHAVSEPVLLIDDVATSGAHLEEGVKLLKPTCNGVMPVAWIGGNANEA